jgi:hypothetical protein
MRTQGPQVNFLFKICQVNNRAVATKGCRLARLWAIVIFMAGLLVTGGAGRAGAQGRLSLSASTMNFGSVTVGASKAVSITMKNSGSSKIEFTKEALKGAEFSVIGFALPLTLAPSKELTLIVEFNPRRMGT